MLRMIEIDKCFNLESNSTDSHINFDKFQDDLLQIAEEERVHMEVTKYDTEMEEEARAKLSSQRSPSNRAQMNSTVSEMMKVHLSNHKMDQKLYNEFTEFSSANLKPIDLIPKEIDHEDEEDAKKLKKSKIIIE